MALPETTTFGKFRVLLGNGASPQVFAAPCGFTNKSFSRTKELRDIVVPDCDDPDAMAHTRRSARSLSASISGSGVMARTAYPVWQKAYADAKSVDCKIEFAWENGSTTTITQKYHVSSFEMSAELGDLVQVSIEMQSDGGFVEATA